MSHIKLHKLTITIIIIGIALYALYSKEVFAQEIPPAIIIGKAYSSGGYEVASGTEIIVTINGYNVGSAKTSAGGKFTIMARGQKGDTLKFTIGGNPAIETVRLSNNGEVHKMDISTIAGMPPSPIPTYIPIVIDNSVETNIRDPLGGALIRIFRFNNREKTWAFYDPDPLFSEVNTLRTVHSHEAYWIRVYLDIQVTLNNRSMWLYEGWNLVAY